MTFEQQLRHYLAMGELSLSDCERLWNLYERHGIAPDDQFYSMCDKHELFKYIIDLGSKNYVVRKKAAYALGNIGDRRAVPFIINQLKNDNVSSVRQYTAWVLGEIGDSRAVPALIERFQNDKDVSVRATAAEALGNIGDDRAVDPLIDRLHSEHWGVREYAARALGGIGDLRAVEPLIDRYQNEIISSVRRSAAEALEKLGVDPDDN